MNEWTLTPFASLQRFPLVWHRKKERFASFTDTPDLRPYSALGSRIDLNARNTAVAYGAERSKGMDFSEFDRIDDFDLNEILWHAVKGQDAPMPPAVRRAIAQRVAVPKL